MGEQQGRIMKLILCMLLSYIGYCAMVVPVIMLFAMLSILYVMVMGTHLYFMEYLQPWAPRTMQIGNSEIIEAFAILSFIVSAIGSAIRFALGKLNIRLGIGLRQRLLLASAFIILCYTLIFLSIPSQKVFEGSDDLYVAMSVFFITTLFFTAAAIVADFLIGLMQKRLLQDVSGKDRE